MFGPVGNGGGQRPGGEQFVFEEDSSDKVDGKDPRLETESLVRVLLQ